MPDDPQQVEPPRTNEGSAAGPTAETTGSSDEVAPPASATPAPSRGKPATVEDAQDSDDEDASPSKPADPIEDAVSKVIAAAEAGEAPEPHAWQAVWAPAQNAYYFYNSKVRLSVDSQVDMCHPCLLTALILATRRRWRRLGRTLSSTRTRLPRVLLLFTTPVESRHPGTHPQQLCPDNQIERTLNPSRHPPPILPTVSPPHPPSRTAQPRPPPLNPHPATAVSILDSLICSLRRTILSRLARRPLPGSTSARASSSLTQTGRPIT